MKKGPKGCLIIMALCFLIILLIISWFYYQMITSRERQDDDIAACMNIEYITEKPSFSLEKESYEKILDLNIQLKRDGQIIRDTLLKEHIENKNNYFIFIVPFDKFLKTDVVLVKTKNTIYTISGFAYSSTGGHWGMFGYLGDSDCYFDYNQIKINGKDYLESKK
ncbi:hypothetical protein AR687_17260 [Flavobacteriaceae bacterium CRH]|nr:hypothetical protein AR687_17260 [Flavobacteriaceae bacterium CRH]